MTLIADVILEILAPKNIVRSMSEKPCFRGPLELQHHKWVKTLYQSKWQHLSDIY